MFYRWDSERLVLDCSVQPKSSEEKIVGVVGESLKIKLKAAPTDGKANKQLIKLLAKEFRAKQIDIEIISGTSSRKKRIGIYKPVTIPENLGIVDERPGK